MPNQVHSTPRIRNHHQIADRSRTPARMVSRRVVDGGASLVIAGPLCSPLLAGPISRPPAGGGMAGHTLVPWCRRAGTVTKTTITVDGRRVSSQIQAPTRRRGSPRSGWSAVPSRSVFLVSVSGHARGDPESLVGWSLGLLGRRLLNVCVKFSEDEVESGVRSTSADTSSDQPLSEWPAGRDIDRTSAQRTEAGLTGWQG